MPNSTFAFGSGEYECHNNICCPEISSYTITFLLNAPGYFSCHNNYAIDNRTIPQTVSTLANISALLTV